MRTKLLILLVFTSGLLFAQDKKFTLEDCRQMALQHNKKIKIADENKLMMNSIHKSAKTQYYPRIGFTGGYIRTNKEISLFSENVFLPVVPSDVITNGKINQIILGTNPDLLDETFVLNPDGSIALDANGNPLFENYAYLPADEASLDLNNIFLMNFGLTQPVYMGGKIKELNNLAMYGEELFDAKKNLTETEVIIETDKRYWQVVSLKEKVKLTSIYMEMLERLIIDLDNIYEEGIITYNDLLKAKVKYNEIGLKHLKAGNGVKLAQMALNQTIGFPLDTLIVLSDSITVNVELPDENRMADMALNNRPEIDMVNNLIAIAESGEKIIKSRYLPNIGLTANYLFTNPNPYNGFEKEFGGDWNVGVVVNVPIYHWGDRKHTVNATRHKTKSFKIQLEEAKELITLEVQQILFKYSESLKKIEMTEISLQQAEENLKITKNSFEEGVLKTKDLLEAQTMWQDAYSEFIDAKTENKLCESEILRVSGQLRN
ncbi:MAG: TolC family protein [Bacteroidales bacterium]|nr:TolC family protein [Bacteroidales bacterium]